ncbi:MAG: tRNA preQ1(34) S-adenosylmethionine ribosyltransferase-isomerase QueA [Holophagales bacterium]|jgi:S-adenosylmethionine:tRNA ribosyltransferase-isomerase|nr:tRNA preQ1(34) S-adenosylmethionine ribosyltransferase-isomerase QueA [Holophagales bacterium]
MKRSAFNFELPGDLIAQRPTAERDGARLLVVDAANGSIAHSHIRLLPEWTPEASLCVPNDVKVRHARLFLRRPGGGEALLLKFLGNGRFEALVRPGAKLKQGKHADVIDPADNSILAELFVEAELDGGLRIVALHGDAPLDWDGVDSIGSLPLPPYIQRAAGAEDDERYQTVFHSQEGEAVAAPTAGLHLTEELIGKLEQKQCAWRPIRLHVGLGTFRPMTAENIEDHAMHEELYEIPESTALELESALRNRGRNIAAIGTTSLRALEAAWDGANLKRRGATRIFIRPGYSVKTANYLLTNFHLPESTLFVLVSALMGLELAHRAYKTAIQEKYRFFSYGDAMLIKNVIP